MRLDFSTFVITGPSTSTTTAYSILNGEITPAGGSGASHGTRCLTDTFSVSPAADYNPTICGTNTGEHSKLDILFLSNHNIHKSSCFLYFWASDPLVERF